MKSVVYYQQRRNVGFMARIQDRGRLATARIKRSELMPPAEFAGDPIVWAAWLYYEERMTQEEIAEQLGVSRATVVNFLQEARDRNVVTIAVASEYEQWARVTLTLPLAKEGTSRA